MNTEEAGDFDFMLSYLPKNLSFLETHMSS